ncbi:MAG TPA: TonB-dependent receptor [Chthoniobacteraceae bacterium]|nr:TonB-dependent receptor [Chthoniobacteraceae bacterium]
MLFHPLSISVAAILASAAAPLRGQVPTTLPEVVVTDQSAPSLTVPSIDAIRTEFAETPGAVGIVDAEQYKRGRATTLKDALDFAPGVFVQPRFGAEEARLSIRGSGIQRTFHGRGIKLLQDGVPLNLADGGFDFQAVEPLSTRYVEVYRGANALEYGSTTLGGAINFVSLTGHEASPFTARFELGSFESIRGQVSSGEVVGPFDFYVSVSHASQDGFRDQSQQSSQRLFANFGYRINENLETRFYVTYVQTDSELPGNLTKLQLEDNPQEAQRVPILLRSSSDVARFDHITSNWKRDFELLRIANKTTKQNGDHRLSLNSFWSYKDLDHPILFVIDQLSNDFGVDLRYDNSTDLLGHKNKFTIGFAPTYGLLQDNRYANHFGNRGEKFADSEQKALNLDLYLQNRFYILPKVALVGGAQVSYAKRENDDEFHGAPGDPDNSDTQEWWGFSPKFGVLWEITPDAQAYLNVGRSFEPPSFGELGNALNNGAGLVSLDAQTATTLEVGTRGRAGRVGWDVAWYYAWLDDELLQFQVQPGLTQTVNAGRTIHQGVEAGIEFDVVRGLFVCESASGMAKGHVGKKVVVDAPESDRLLLRQVYLWNNFQFDGDATFENNQLPGIPEHYYRAELVYEHAGGFYAGPNVEWVAKKYNVDSAETLFADPYALLGFKVGYRTERGFSFYVEAKNLTDKKYAATTDVVERASPGQALFLPGDGRGYFAGIEFRW